MPGRHGQYPPELRERAVRLVAECCADLGSEWEAMRSPRATTAADANAAWTAHPD